MKTIKYLAVLFAAGALVSCGDSYLDDMPCLLYTSDAADEL